MPDTFDAYYEWLGIPPREQPPTAYRLLGIEQGEANPHVIQNAAERQTTYVRSRQLGPRQQAAQALLNEISAARVLLLDPRRKAEYDASLAAQRGPGSGVAAAVLPPPVVGVGPPVVAPSKADAPRVLRGDPAGGATAWFAQPLLWGLAAAGMVFLAGAVWALMQSRGPTSPSAERPPVRVAPPAGDELRLPEIGFSTPPAEPEPLVGRGDKPARAGRPAKKPRKGKRLDPTLPETEEPLEPTEPAPMPEKPPHKRAAEKELDRGMVDLADELLNKLTRPAEPPVAEPAPLLPPEPAKPGKRSKKPLPGGERMAYVVEPTPGGLRVTIHDTPFGTATVILEGDFTAGTTHNLTRTVTPPAGVDAPGRGEALIEVEVVDGKVARVAWDDHDIPRRK